MDALLSYPQKLVWVEKKTKQNRKQNFGCRQQADLRTSKKYRSTTAQRPVELDFVAHHVSEAALFPISEQDCVELVQMSL